MGYGGSERVALSNTHLPHDTKGELLLTGEASILKVGEAYYLYFNNWGGCPGVDCCESSGGCASCCFKGPSDPCVYTNNHSVVVYKTGNFQDYEYRGVALNTSARLPGIVFRPQVIYNKQTQRYIMWYEDRHKGQRGYAVAAAPEPEGPFETIKNSVKMAGKGRDDGSGDFSLLVDDDGLAYHVRDGFVIEQLDANYTGGTGNFGLLNTPKPSEGPTFFKRNDTYYILPGTSCCACKGGSSIYVYTAPSPLGPYTFRGDIGSNPQPFDPHSPSNYVTNAQASAVFEVDGQFVWVGNQWVSSRESGHPRNHDLLYWTVFDFNDDGSIKQVVYNESAILSIPFI